MLFPLIVRLTPAFLIAYVKVGIHTALVSSPIPQRWAAEARPSHGRRSRR